MELILRCAVANRPGALAGLAGAIAEAGGDIEAVDVVDSDDDRALDDLVVVIHRSLLTGLVERLRGLDGLEVIHAGPSRGHPSDGVTRLAVGLQALLDGAMPYERAVTTLVGGLLRASAAEVCDAGDAPPADERTLVLAVGDRVLVVRRDYRFTPTEQGRAGAVARACVAADDVRAEAVRSGTVPSG